VLAHLGSGGMADVYAGAAAGLCGFEQLVALKTIRPTHAADPEFLRMFVDEARIAMHLRHSNVVQMLELGRADGRLFLAQEYVDGLDLALLTGRALSRRTRAPVPVALFVAVELTQALHVAHSARAPDGRPLSVVHRDVSPPNVLISFSGEVKLGDFGLARAADRITSTQPGLLKGKVAYAAPELFRAQPADGRSDLWSLGVLLYELLTGEPPYLAHTVHEVLDALDRGLVVEPPSRVAPVDASLDALVLSLLEVDPSRRMSSALELADTLAWYVERLSPAAPIAKRLLANWVRTLVPERGLPVEPIGPPRTSVSPEAARARVSVAPSPSLGALPAHGWAPPSAMRFVEPAAQVAPPRSAVGSPGRGSAVAAAGPGAGASSVYGPRPSLLAPPAPPARLSPNSRFGLPPVAPARTGVVRASAPPRDSLAPAPDARDPPRVSVPPPPTLSLGPPPGGASAPPPPPASPAPWIELPRTTAPPPLVGHATEVPRVVFGVGARASWLAAETHGLDDEADDVPVTVDLTSRDIGLPSDDEATADERPHEWSPPAASNG
jgi:serine/threonine protein kinase